MRQRYRLYRRKNGGRYYIHDDATGKQESLGTSDRATAVRLFHSKSEAVQQPAVNLHLLSPNCQQAKGIPSGIVLIPFSRPTNGNSHLRPKLWWPGRLNFSWQLGRWASG